MEHIGFLSYVPPPAWLAVALSRAAGAAASGSSPYETPDEAAAVDPAQVDARLELLRMLVADLQYLRGLSHAEFWSHAVYDESLHALLDSYLQHAPRSFDRGSRSGGGGGGAAATTAVDEATLTRAVRLEQELAREVFVVFARLATPRESPTAFISEAVYADLLYENWIFDMAKLVDLASIYAASNAARLAEMVRSIFALQPKYLEDLADSACTAVQILGMVVNRCDQYTTTLQCGPAVGAAAAALAASGAAAGSARSSAPSAAKIAEARRNGLDTARYAADIAASLGAFLGVFPPAGRALVQAGLLPALSELFAALQPMLADLVERFAPARGAGSWERDLAARCRHHVLRLGRLLVQHLVDAAVARDEPQASQPLADQAFMALEKLRTDDGDRAPPRRFLPALFALQHGQAFAVRLQTTAQERGLDVLVSLIVSVFLAVVVSGLRDGSSKLLTAVFHFLYFLFFLCCAPTGLPSRRGRSSVRGGAGASGRGGKQGPGLRAGRRLCSGCWKRRQRAGRRAARETGQHQGLAA